MSRGCVNYNLPFIVGKLISDKIATMKELTDYYTYDEALLMLDISLTDQYNEFIITDNYKKTRKIT